MASAVSIRARQIGLLPMKGIEVKRFLVLVAVLVAFLSLIAPAAARASTTPAGCSVTAYQMGTYPYAGPDEGIVIAASKGCGDTIPEVSYSIYSAHSISGNPISSQVWETGDDIELAPYPKSSWISFGGGIPGAECYVQVDVAYGPTIHDLSTPYGSKLIAAFHSGSRDCLTPTPTPTTSAPTPTPSVTTTPTPTQTTPTSSPTSTPKPSESVPASSTPPSRPKPSPTTTHTVKPTPSTSSSPSPTDSNPGRASGCVADGCDTPAPTPSATTSAAASLPMTGASHMGLLATAGAGLLVIGATLLGSLAYFRRRNLIE